MPAEIAAEEPEPTDRPVRTPAPAGGTLVRFTEMAPGAEAPMHRTETVDVGVVLEGETWLLLDDGSETRMTAGDVVVQRGTNHAWANRSDAPVRMMFVMIDGAITDDAARRDRPARVLRPGAGLGGRRSRTAITASRITTPKTISRVASLTETAASTAVSKARNSAPPSEPA